MSTLMAHLASCPAPAPRTLYIRVTIRRCRDYVAIGYRCDHCGAMSP